MFNPIIKKYIDTNHHYCAIDLINTQVMENIIAILINIEIENDRYISYNKSFNTIDK